METDKTVQGTSFVFLGREYKRFRVPREDANKTLQTKDIPKLQIGDVVYIHPVKPNAPICPATIDTKRTSAPKPGKELSFQTVEELWLSGIQGNRNWYGTVLNQHYFDRLELIKPAP